MTKQTSLNLTKVVKAETRKLEKKENNTIIFGLSDKTTDSLNNLVNKLFADLNLTLKILNSKKIKTKTIRFN